MKRDTLIALALSAAISGCAVSANEFEPAALPQIAASSATINERYEVRVIDPSVLSVNATVLGTTCSAVGVSGDFQDRFPQVMQQALGGVFAGNETAGATSISIALTPETPRVRMLRRGYVSGDARVDFAMAAHVVVTRANGEREEIHISPDSTRTQVDEETSTCDGAARALGAAFDQSASKLATQVRDALLD